MILMEYVKVASTKNLSSGGKINVKIGNKEILVVNLNGKYYAIGNVCTHKGCKLSNGTLSEGKIECPCHGSVFDIKNGKVVSGPAKKSEPVFKIKIEGNQILVNV
jgi:nitrite reductase/ring-hydroxylating ferredoxin subunit